MSCGKTTTLKAVYAKMNQQSPENAVFIDMKAISNHHLKKVVVDDTFTASVIVYFIDNAQILADNTTTTSLVKELLSTAGNVCLAFSPVLDDALGNSLIRSGIKGAHVIYFSPFSEEEFKQYKLALHTSLPSWVPEKTGNIPEMLTLLSAANNIAVAAMDVQFQLNCMLRHQLRSVESKLKDPVTQHETYIIHVALRHAAIYGCNSLTPHSNKMLLLKTGFCFTRDNGLTVKLTYPNDTLLEEMKYHMDIISSIVREIDTGAALEYEFLFAARNGVTAKCMNDPDKEVLEIPRSHKNVWRQPEHGAIPDYQETAEGCLIMKLAENHCAIDFLILNSTSIGRRSRRLYFVQVSSSAYVDHAIEKRCSAIRKTFVQLKNMSPLSHYSEKLKVNERDCFFVYATSSTSTSVGRSEAFDVYKVQL